MHRLIDHSIVSMIFVLFVSSSGLMACSGESDTGIQLCDPGTTFTADDGCNTCTCPNSGDKGAASCTELACPGGTCTPGALITAPDGCNTCTCPESGKAAEGTDCTLMICPEPEQCDGVACGSPCTQIAGCDSVCNFKGECVCDIGEVDECEDPESCEPGSQFSTTIDGCEFGCTCPDSGSKVNAICEGMPCPPYEPCADKNCGDSCTTCAPNASDCIETEEAKACNDNGECVSAPLSQCDDTCEPGSTFEAPDNCNSCTCPDSGKKSEAACTEMACPPQDDCLGKACGSECDIPNADCAETFCDAKETCQCIPKSEIDCKKDPCALVLCEAGSVCVDGQCIYDPCFATDCGDACTLCSPDDKDCKETDVEKACDIDGQCDAGPSNCKLGPGQCTPGTSFPADDGCNTCTCPGNGKKSDGMCTEMACPPNDCSQKKCGDECALVVDCIASCNADGKCVCNNGDLQCGDKPIQCVGDNQYFPKFEADCESSKDCIVVFHQVDCCGNQVALGINPSESDNFSAAEQICSDQYPGCGCPMGPHKADDGTFSMNKNDFSAKCKNKVCTTTTNKPCKSNKDCEKKHYCDFTGNTCSLYGGTGSCVVKPKNCPDPGGVGVCSCDGKHFLNSCDAAAAGSDVFKYGGCKSDPEKLKCGNTNCDPDSEYCTIYINDVGGPNEPKYSASCTKYSDKCMKIKDGKTCKCVTSAGGWCYDAESPVVIWPGG
ncbi:MAG TPA: hypothetical protein EYN66_04245 [Myxococcales bacterium]|nr:hypothetical protein [Myxococcales bacterium]